METILHPVVTLPIGLLNIYVDKNLKHTDGEGTHAHKVVSSFLQIESTFTSFLILIIKFKNLDLINETVASNCLL